MDSSPPPASSTTFASTYASRRSAEEGKRAAEEAQRIIDEERRTLALQKAAKDAKNSAEEARRLALEAKRPTRSSESGLTPQKLPKASDSSWIVSKNNYPPAALFSPIGVTVRFLAEFREQHGVKLVARTTAEVCKDIIAPLTTESKLSYCELLHFKGDKSLGSATVLISHAWSCRFTDFLDAVLHHFRGREHEVLWIDVFSSNLHASSEQLDCGFIADQLRVFKRTLVVLTPLVDPAALKRTWCLWELSCAVIENHEIDIILTENDRIRFADAVISGRVRESLAAVDLKSSEATTTAERDEIHSEIEIHAGIDTSNAQVIEKLQDAVIKHIHKFLLYDAQKPPSSFSEQIQKVVDDAKIDQDTIVHLCSELGRFYVCRHRYDEAEVVFKKCLALRRLGQGDEHPDTLTAMRDLAQLYSFVDKTDMAAPLLQELFPWANIEYLLSQM